ncbi:MAG: hypothetical protein ACRDRO_15810 [Pseudonocardiaceae bacterium]
MAVMDYRTQDGLADYGFSIEFQPGRGWRVYIIFDPFRKGQDDCLQLPYQSFQNDQRRYVDWPSQLENLGEAKTVAGLWAELTQRHQRAQEKQERYAELIQRYWRAQKGSNASSGPSSDAA